VKPQIVRLDRIYLVGLLYYGENKHGEIPRLWGEFSKCMNDIINRKGNSAYGLCVSPENDKSGNFQYVSAVEVNELSDYPIYMVGKVIPANDYAVFTHVGPVSKLRETYDKIYNEWTERSDIKLLKTYDFELYDHRFKGSEDPESVIDIYFSINSR